MTLLIGPETTDETTPHAPQATPPPADAIPRGCYAALPRRRVRDFAFVLWCVVLPVAVVVIELTTHLCAEVFFNPLPSPWHVGLVSIVPIANFLVWWMTGQDEPRRLRWLALLNGAAIGVGLYYALIFAPLLPFAACAVLLLGIGLLPMAPLFGLIGALGCRSRLRAWSAAAQRARLPLEKVRPVPGLWTGFVAALAMLVALQLPAAITHYGLKRAASARAEDRERGLALLRRFGSDREMLRACRRQGQFEPYPLVYAVTLGDPASPKAAREAYYRVTGSAYDSSPRSDARGRRSRWADDGDGWDDQDESSLRGGEQVGGVLPGLSLADSQLDGTVYPGAAGAGLEWTMAFRNDTDVQQEARARVALPPGGVVSRVTLWIDGQEREAAFGRRGQAQGAYQQVAVVQRRDPVLVTTAGRDRVQVQCFPVPPHGTMKVRLGIAAPLQLRESEAPAAERPLPGRQSEGRERSEAGVVLRESFVLPAFSERNFAVPDGEAHAVRVTSAAPLTTTTSSLLSAASAGDAKAGAPASYVLRGTIDERRLAARVVLHATSPVPAALVADDPFDAAGTTGPTSGPARAAGRVVQKVERVADPSPSRLVLVVDASAAMGPTLKLLCDELPNLPPALPVCAVVAADGVLELSAPAGQAGGAAEIARQLRQVPTRGGQDAVPALCRAWDLAAGSPGAAVLWVHGQQPMLLQQFGPNEPWVRRQTDGPRLLELSASAGPNRVADALVEGGAWEMVPAVAAPRENLHELFTAWSAGRPRLQVLRSRQVQGQADRPLPGDPEILTDEAPADPAAARLVAQLWAADAVRRLLERQPVSLPEPSPPSATAQAAAEQVAVSHRVVTPVSGAVVLEKKEQYEQAGLQPPVVQAVPLPPAALLILTAVPVVAVGHYIHRRRSRRA